MDSEQMAELANNLGTEFVKIHVGLERKEYVIHKDIICEKSDYFSQVFANGFKETEEAAIYLRNETPDVFGLFVDWLYRGTLPRRSTELFYWDLLKLYVFAEKIKLDGLADDIITLIIILGKERQMTRFFNLDTTDYVYSKTRRGSPLRKFCIHKLAYDLHEIYRNPSSPEQNIEGIWELSKSHPAFFMDYLEYVHTGTAMRYDPFSFEFGPYHACQYHIHSGPHEMSHVNTAAKPTWTFYPEDKDADGFLDL